MEYQSEKIITINFFEDGNISIEASGYNEQIDPGFKAGHTKNIEELRHKHACINDCYTLIQSIGKLEEITPKETKKDNGQNHVRLL